MCIFGRPTPKPVKVKPPAPPPPTPPAPPAPKPLPTPTPLDTEDETTKPNVKYGKKKADSSRARAGRTADSLRIPLNNPSPGGKTGGLNA